MLDRRTFSAIVLAGAVGAALAACAPREPVQPNIREVIDSDASFSTLAQALDLAGVEALGAGGPFTVFAPRNPAFAALPEGTVQTLLLPENRAELTQVLQLHIVPGSYSAADLLTRTSDLTTASGLYISVDGLNVGGVAVVQPDIQASNGIVHVVDGVILPPE